MSIAPPGDEHEQQADRVSEQVMRMPKPHPKKSCCGAERAASGVSGGAGKPLDAATRDFMEPRFGHNFGHVRIHTGQGAETAAAALGARAFTVGADVAFGRGEFAPESQPGRALLAHELTHVVQSQTGPRRLYRKEKIEPHYPTEDEQHDIEKILSREFKGNQTQQAAPGKPAPERAVQLNATEIEQLANSLKEPYLNTIGRLYSSGSASSDGALDDDEAFQVVTQARDDIYKHFGAAPKVLTLTRDEKTTPAQRRAAHQVLVRVALDDTVVVSLARTLATTHCDECLAKLSPLNQASKSAVIDRLIQFGMAEDGGKKLRRVAETSVPGAYSRQQVRLRLRKKPKDELYHTAVHEFIHALAHPVFFAAFGGSDNIDEGFTEYFAQEVVGGVDPAYKDKYEKIVSLRSAMSGPFISGASNIDSAEESLRQAYFQGRLDLIGWKASGKDEENAVKAAAIDNQEPEPKQWDATTAKRYAAIYEAQALAQQAASRNVIGVGLYFSKGSGSSIAVRYARVIGQTQRARGQLLVEGQLLDTTLTNPGKLGASLGIAAEYQEPYFYAQAGLRLVGTAIPGGDSDRLDVSPFAGAGVRAWHTVRVGVEGFAAVPATGGQGTGWGVGATVGVEFK